MKKNMFKSLLLVSALLLAACNDGMTDYLNDYKTILYFTNSGETTTTIYRTGENNICPVVVYKAGSDEKATTSATVALMNESEITSYNIEHGTAFSLLPSNCYSIDPASLTIHFGANDQYRTIDLLIDPIEFEAIPDRDTKKYIVGLRLVSSSDSINSAKEIILVRPTIEDAKILFGKVGYQSNSVQVSGVGDITLTLPINITMVSAWDDLQVNLAIDPQMLEGTSYKQLEASAYTFPSEVKIPKGKKTANVEIVVKRTALNFGTFVIPIKIASISKDFFKSSPNTASCLMGVTKFPAQITLSADKMSIPDGFLASGDGGGLAALVDGNTETYMHTAYSPKPAGNSTYGVYFDVELEKAITMLSFGFTTRKTNGNGAPKKAAIFVSNDKTTWSKLCDVTSGMPTTANTVYTSEVYPSDKSFKYVRFCCLESVAGAMNVDGTDASYFNLSEFILYGL